jgi:cyanate permease
MIGFVVMGSARGATLGPACFGLMYDAFGDYTAVLTAMGVLLVVCIALNGWLFSKRSQDGIGSLIAAQQTAQ